MHAPIGLFACFPLDNKKPAGRIAAGTWQVMTAQTDLMPAARAAFYFRQIGVLTVGMVAVLPTCRSRQMT
jgi:hypothetical protein